MGRRIYYYYMISTKLFINYIMLFTTDVLLLSGIPLGTNVLPPILLLLFGRRELLSPRPSCYYCLAVLNYCLAVHLATIVWPR